MTRIFLKKHFTKLLSALLLSLAVAVQAEDVAVKTGDYTPDWESLSGWDCPEWFKDAKFGIWAHWGPQCFPEAGDWYARFMYYPGSGQYNYHVANFGNPSAYGLKELCHNWKAENWDPERLVNLYKSVGARYFMALGNHHDNFDLWNSPYQEWNSVNVGPKKDIVKGWSDACKKAGLPLGVSIHASHAWTWLEPSQAYDGNLTREDGYTLNKDSTEKWWKGLDPQELYAQRHTHSTGWNNSGTIHSQWNWGNGASQPSAAYKTKFQNRVLELINDYNPDILYFDDTAMPFYGCDDAVGQNILAHYYNHSAGLNGGIPNVVVTGKQLTTEQKNYMLWDVERGIPDRVQQKYWQTCTCIGDWHYNKSTYNNGSYKSATQVVNMLVDIVSKNGNLLLSIPVKGDGTIDHKEEAVLAGIKAWMDINSTSIYGTRPWKTFGEGPLAEAANPLSAQGFNEGNNYSSRDVRFVQRNDTVFATIMRWPASETFSFASFSMTSEYYSGKVESVQLLGHGDVAFTEHLEGVTVTLPETKPNEIAPVFRFVFDNSEVTLSEIIGAYETRADQLMSRTGRNTGNYIKGSILAFKEQLEAAKSHLNDSVAAQKVIINQLREAYKALKTTGRHQPGGPETGHLADLTIAQLIQAGGFTASTQGTRFGTPKNWTVENFRISQRNSAAGVKNGIDNFPKYNTLSLGIWSGDDVEPYTCDLTNARIYRRVHLEPGRYYFGSTFEANYQMSDKSYIFAAKTVLATDKIEDEALAFAKINRGGTGKFYGIYFTIDEAQDIVLGFQANLTEGANQQEFRIQSVKLLSYGIVDLAALNRLIHEADDALANIIINENTGYYKRETALELQATIDAAGLVTEESPDDELADAFEQLKHALNTFLENGKNPGGHPDTENAIDITTDKLTEADHFTRADKSVTTRFAAPKYWTVENFRIPNGSDGVKAGLDKYDGYDCLYLGLWNDRSSNQAGNLANARIYQKVSLMPGRYYFGNTFSALYQLNKAYLFASDSLLTTNEIETKSIAFEPLMNGVRGDGQYYGIFFTLEEEKDLYLGFQADLATGSNTQEFRASSVILYSYTPPAGIDRIKPEPPSTSEAPSYYTITGIKLQSPPEHGFYIVRQGNKTYKAFRR